MTFEFKGHISVLYNEVMTQLESSFGKEKTFTFFDFTFGGGGHSFGVLENFPNATVVAFDQDPDALENGNKRIENSPFANRIHLLKSNFSEFDSALKNANLDIHPDAILMDLGVSSHHFDEGQRGFSFRFDGPLDMRMNYKNGKTASDVINSYTPQELKTVFEKYGEIFNSEKLIQKIVDQRKARPINSTFELRDITYSVWSKKAGKIDPCTQVFQALRMEVNAELDVVETAISKVPRLLNEFGIVMIITFHSLEDRLVKNAFKDLVDSEIPFEILTKKPIVPSDEEISNNKRSRSAKMRVLRRIKDKKLKNKYQIFSRKEE